MALSLHNPVTKLSAGSPNSGVTSQADAEFIVITAHDEASLAKHIDAWDGLAENSVEPNAFYESWMLLPAVRYFAADQDLTFVLVYRNKRGGRELCGLFPLIRQNRFKGLPASCLSLWEYDECGLCTPLLRRDNTRQTLSVFLDWLRDDRRGAALLELQEVGGDGPFYRSLIDELRSRGTLSDRPYAYSRALFQRRQSADDYLEAAISASKKRDLNRKKRRLEEFGSIDYEVLQSIDDLDHWLETFFELEASGWKGREGSALACKPQSRAYFADVAREGFKRGRFLMLALRLDRQPIALRCNFVSPPGSFFYKPAYDESYSRFSPGVLLELETIRHLHARPDVEWMDSCTDPENSLLNNLWLDRRMLQTVVAATGTGAGRLVLSTVPLLRWINRRLSRHRKPTQTS